jgi:SDR family mycofactocin-dependent oxidoreductase
LSWIELSDNPQHHWSRIVNDTPSSLADRREGRLAGKVALITGAARGQGRNHAVRLAAEGADIVAIDICAPVLHVSYETATSDDLAVTARLVREAGGRAVTAAVDVRDATGMVAATAQGVAELGRLDVVVANAGVVATQRWDEITPETWETVVGVNLTGTWNTCQATVPHLLDAGGGSMILVSSVSGTKGLPFLTHYTASKHGVVGIMRGLANELASDNIRVNSLHPTGVDTPMISGMMPLTGYIKSQPRTGPLFENALPVNHIEVDDVSDAVVFLASDESRFVTGMTMAVDAGASNR